MRFSAASSTAFCEYPKVLKSAKPDSHLCLRLIFLGLAIYTLLSIDELLDGASVLFMEVGLILAATAVGFALGYGVREAISQHRRAEARRRRQIA
jgi:hypothetical protein